jgi:CubicO group peptidase (beta-lactamase class C family)
MPWTGRGRSSARVSPSRTCRACRSRSASGRPRVGRRLRLGGSRDPDAGDAGHAVPDRHRVQGAHLGRRRPAAREGSAELDDEIQAHVPEFPEKEWPVTLRQLMGHVAGVRNDGGDEGPLLSARCERPNEAAGGPSRSAAAVRAGDAFRYSSYGWILVSAAVEAAADEPFLTFMREQIFEPLGMDDTIPDSADRSDPGSGDVLLPAVRGGSALRPAPDAPDRLLLLRGIERIPLHAVRPGALRHGDGRGTLLQPATVQLLQAHSGCRPGRRRVWPWLGARDRHGGGRTGHAASATTGRRSAGGWRRS